MYRRTVTRVQAYDRHAAADGALSGMRGGQETNLLPREEYTMAEKETVPDSGYKSDEKA